MADSFDDLAGVTQIIVTGERISIERDSSGCTGWIVTGWEQGLPVARKPIDKNTVLEIIRRYPQCVFRY